MKPEHALGKGVSRDARGKDDMSGGVKRRGDLKTMETMKYNEIQ